MNLLLCLKKTSSHFGYKELTVWHKAISFADYGIGVGENLELDRKHVRLCEQFESVATSVPLNIAEGKGRESKKEFVRFLYIARGSLYELLTLATLFYRREWISFEQLDFIEQEGFEIVRMLKGLINSIRQIHE